MENIRAYDEVKVTFTDGTSTIIYVDYDDNIQDAIVELCEQEGWDTEDVTDFAIKTN